MNNEQLDEAKYRYARGWSILSALADRISVIAHEGNPISPDERGQIHDELNAVFEQIERTYVLLVESFDFDNEGRYSDGTRVWSAVQPANGNDFPREAVYRGDFGPADELLPGAEVIVEEPPSWKMAGLSSNENTRKTT